VVFGTGVQDLVVQLTGPFCTFNCALLVRRRTKVQVVSGFLFTSTLFEVLFVKHTFFVSGAVIVFSLSLVFSLFSSFSPLFFSGIPTVGSISNKNTV
jgi:hypothetical protein